MANKKEENANEEFEGIPTVNEEDSEEGSIHIADRVIESIVRHAALEVEGVTSVRKANLADVAGKFLKKDPGSGVVVQHDNRQYKIALHINLAFGVNIANTASEVDAAVTEHVSKMTGKPVTRVDVFVDDLDLPARDGDKEDLDPDDALD